MWIDGGRANFDQDCIVIGRRPFDVRELNNIRGVRIWYRRRLSLAFPIWAGLLPPTLNFHANHEEHHLNVATPNNLDIRRGCEHDEFTRHVAPPARTILDVIGTPSGGSLPYCRVSKRE
jgi:hypothetical protein